MLLPESDRGIDLEAIEALIDSGNTAKLLAILSRLKVAVSKISQEDLSKNEQIELIALESQLNPAKVVSNFFDDLCTDKELHQFYLTWRGPEAQLEAVKNLATDLYTGNPMKIVEVAIRRGVQKVYSDIVARAR